MRFLLLLTIASITFLIVSCSKSSDDKNFSVITERIQYDVTIKSPDPDMDWWVQNIEGAKRETLIKMILDNVYEGKSQAYSFLNNPMSVEEVKGLGVRNDTLIMPSMEPPYEDSVVVINEKLRVNDINRIRFLEEWLINENTLEIKKNTLGIALMISDFAPDGEFRGYRHLFWVYFDKRYPLNAR